jgi:hypothetical protein
MSPFSRRLFMSRSAQVGCALASSSLVSGLSHLSADETSLAPGAVQFDPDTESLVRLIEDTSRDQLLEVIAGRIHEGLSYQKLLAGLFLAGIRNVQPRPAVGFKFHAVLVVNSAHIASMASPDSDRWLPIFWALDEFKGSQAADVREGDWTMAAVDESKVPDAVAVRRNFHEAMQTWDVPRADGAAAGLARYVGATDVLELFAQYAARDFRSIGHKAIYVANAWRTLQTIGWHHAEPILRSLSYALLNHNGEPNPATSDLAADRPWRRNEELATQFPENWAAGKLDSGATSQMLSVLRSGSADDATDKVLQLISAGVSPQSVFDALHTGSGELLMRQPGIVALHAVTTTNAIHFLFDTTGDDNTRKMLLLQNAAFLPLFREAMQSRGNVADQSVESLTAADPAAEGPEQLKSIFDDVSGNRYQAAGKVLSYLNSGQQAESLIDEARRLIFLKGHNAHDYKFSAAVLEDYYNVSPAWRNRFLATSVYNLKGTGHTDNGLVERIRSALG